MLWVEQKAPLCRDYLSKGLETIQCSGNEGLASCYVVRLKASLFFGILFNG